MNANPTKPNYTYADKIACLKREIAMRRRVYHRKVREDSMSQEIADHELGCMEAILADIQELSGDKKLL